MKRYTLLIVVVQNLLIAFSSISIVSMVSITSTAMATGAQDPPIKVLVIDWMSDPLLSRLNTLINESFDESLGLWLADDLNLLSGRDYWGVSTYRSYAGVGSVYSAEVGETGYAGDHLVINEILYDAVIEMSRPQHEWFEIYNPTLLPVDLYGYVIEDNNHRMKIDSHVIISSREYVVVSNNVTAFREDYPDFNGKIIEEVNNAATETDDPRDDGNAVPVWYDTYYYEDLYLNNGGDWLRLFWIDPGPLDLSGSTFLVDAVAWENMPPTNIYDPPSSSEVGTWNAEDAPDGYSIQRSPNAKDTNNCDEDFYLYPGANLYAITTPGLSNTRNYDDNMDAFLQTSISLLGRNSANLTFHYWIQTEPNYDWLAIQVSENAGITWTTLANYTGDSGGWKYASLNLNSFAGKILVTTRFLFHSDGTNHDFEGAYINEVKVVASPVPYMDNSVETAFWENINSDPSFDVTVKPPVVLDFSTDRLLQVPQIGLSALVAKDIRNYIQELQPDVIVLDDLTLDMFDLWGLNKTERLGLFDYAEQGHGLILTYGSLFDMRVNTTYVGPYGHVNRLYLEQNPSLEDLRNNYRSSLAAASGLGLLPFYEEAREQIANFIAEWGEEGEAIAFTLRSAPLLPVGVPFNGTFMAENASDPILQGIGNGFTIALNSKGINANGTLVGWQLEYPFLMASRAINKTKLLMDKIRPVVRGMVYQVIANVTSKISDFVPGYSFPNVLIDASKLDAIIDNSTTTMMNFLLSLYEARLSMPTELTIPIHFTIDAVTVDMNITIPIPVEIQEIVKPAVIVAESADGLAAVLRYEVGNHRAVYFSFKPSLEPLPAGPCEQLMKNAIKWTSEPPSPTLMTVISNLSVPLELVNAVRSQLRIPDATVAKWNESDVIKEKRPYSYVLDLDRADSVVVYWYGDPAQVTLTLGATTYEATNISVAGGRGAFIGYVSKEGTWTLTIKLKDDDPLLTPIAIETYGDDDPPEIWKIERSLEHPEYKDIVTAKANVTDQQSGVDAVILSYYNGTQWINATMTPESIYGATIPKLPYGTTVEYIVYASDNAGNWKVTEIYSYVVTDNTPPDIGTPSWYPEEPLAYKEVTVNVSVSEPSYASGIKNVSLWFRVADGEWQSEEMGLANGIWTASIQGQRGGKKVEFYIRSYDKAGNHVITQTYSYTVKTEVAPPSVPIEILAGAGIAVLALVGVAIYLIKFRKK